jgi:hypothetical protein
MEALLLLIMGMTNVLCFMIGAKVGQKVVKGEPVELPSLNPMDAVREHQSKRQAEMEMDKVETILRNMEAYDGTSNGQKDVPR